MAKSCETCVWEPDWNFDVIFNPGHGIKRHGRCNWPGNPKYKGNPFIIVTEEKLDYETVIKDSNGKFIETYSSHLPCPKWEPEFEDCGKYNFPIKPQNIEIVSGDNHGFTKITVKTRDIDGSEQWKTMEIPNDGQPYIITD